MNNALSALFEDIYTLEKYCHLRNCSWDQVDDIAQVFCNNLTVPEILSLIYLWFKFSLIRCYVVCRGLRQNFLINVGICMLNFEVLFKFQNSKDMFWIWNLGCLYFKIRI